MTRDPIRRQLELEYWSGSLRLAAGGLIGSGALQGLFFAGLAARAVYQHLTGIESPPEPCMHTQQVVLSSIALFSNLLLIAAGANFRFLKVHLFGWFGAALVMLPITGPLCVLGIPFGMWLVTLLSEIPRDAWHS